MGGIAGKGDGQLVLFLEFVLRLNLVGRDSHDVSAGVAEFRLQSRKVDRLAGATRSVGPWVEIEHELAAVEIGQRHAPAAVAQQLERGCF